MYALKMTSCMSQEQMVEAISNLQKTTNENKIRLDEIYPKLVTIQSQIIEADSRNRTTLDKINELQDFVKSKNQTKKDSIRKQHDKFNSELCCFKVQLEHQRDILLELEKKYFENVQPIQAMFKEQNNKLKDQERKNECKFDEIQREITAKIIDLQMKISETHSWKSQTLSQSDILKLISVNENKFDDVQRRISDKVVELQKQMKDFQCQTISQNNEILYFKKQLFKIGTGEDILQEITTFQLACNYYLTDVAIGLLDSVSDVNVFNEDHMTPLHLACKFGLDDLVIKLLHKNVDVNVLNKEGMTPLHLICKNDKLNEAYKQLNIGCNITQNKNDENSRFVIKNKCEVSLVIELLKLGADSNCKNNAGWTPLHFAAHSGYLEVFMALVKYKADLHCKTNMGFNVLHLAAQGGHMALVTKILKCEVDINSKNKYGVTPLHLAVGRGHLDIVRKLISSGANIYPLAENNLNPLHLGAIRGHDLVVMELLSYGAVYINSETKDKYTPLHFASSNGHVFVVKDLLNHGADANCKTLSGNTALDLAIEMDNTEVIQILKKFQSS